SDLDADLLNAHLCKQGLTYDHSRVLTEKDLKKSLDEEWDLIICDYSMPSLNALKAIELVKTAKPEVPVIVVSGSVGEDLAVETIRAGASDYVMKNNLSRLVPAIERSISERNFR